MNDAQINDLACFLTSYFEDQISGTNIWNTFIKIHKRHYNRNLPFYDCQDYIDEEINLVDVRFLLWYYFQLVDKDFSYSPYYVLHSALAVKIMEIFDEEWEYAPENEKLLKFYQVDENERDFYVIREKIQTVLIHTYLFHFDTALSLLERHQELFEEHGNHYQINSIIRDETDNFTFRTRTKLLALKGQEWLAEFLTDRHPLYNDILNISDKISSHFFKKGSIENYFVLEHIASGIIFNLTKKSIPYLEDFDDKNKVFYIGIIRWRDEWWFSGAYFSYKFDEDFIATEKKSMDSKKVVNFLDRTNPRIEEILNEQLAAFLKFNSGSPIAFLEAEKVQEFVQDYYKFFNRSVIEKQGNNSSVKNDEILSGESTPKDSDYYIDAKQAIVFFNVKSGIEIVYDLESAFPIPENPFLDENKTQEHSINLLEAEYASSELTKYFVEHCAPKISYFTDGVGEVFLSEFDFMLRFWKSYNYHTVPEITL